MRNAHAPARSRARRLSALLLAVGLVAAACGGDDDNGGNAGGGTGDTISSTTIASDVDEVTTGGTLVVGLEAEGTSWTPGIGSFANAQTNVATSLYDSIAARGADGTVYPYLAESIEANEDLTEWTITLRPDITFHDGTPLTADVISRNYEVLTSASSNVAGNLSQVTELRIDDDLTYTYVLAEPNVAFPDLLVGAIGWPFSADAYEADPDGFGDSPVGAGAFQFVSWSRDAEIRLERNPNYWREDDNGQALPYVDELIFRPIPDEDARLASVRSGETQVGQTLRQSIVRQAREAAAGGDIQTFESIGNNGGGAIFNTFRPPVDDLRVRQGLARAVRQDELIEILGGTGITPPQTQFFSPNSPWFSTAVEEAFPTYDAAAAQELLDAYVNDPERSDGKNPGDPIAVEFNCPPDPSLILISQGYQQMWNEVGVEVTLNQVEQGPHITNAIGADADPPLSGNYMINCWRAGADEDPYTTLRSAFGDPAVEATNFTNYTSENIAAQVDILGTSTDFSERYDAVENIMLELAENVPQIWTGGTATALFTTDAVRNVGGWTIPGGIQGDGVTSATIRWSEVWLEQ